ncbi:hypothetical protein P376_0392 [Streptomyces sp. HCCB10043]|nr:hypothetical protein P376_0392 [Streptomyces sp. HCCB10043]
MLGEIGLLVLDVDTQARDVGIGKLDMPLQGGAYISSDEPIGERLVADQL